MRTFSSLACVAAASATFLLSGIIGVARAEPLAKPSAQVRMTIDFGGYRGYWRIDNAAGTEITHDECFIQRVCREAIKPLPEGDYCLVLSGQPQSAQVRFKLTAAGLVITSGASLASADGLTLRTKNLQKVIFDTGGYRGAWSIDLWKGAEATDFFKRDGGEQTIELFADVTYVLNIGPFAAERFQVNRDGKVLLIDDSGVVRLGPVSGNRLQFQTIDAVVYPTPMADTATWSIDGLTPPDGKPSFAGAKIVRLAQGAKYQISNGAADANDIGVAVVTTGKACNMSPQNKKLGGLSVSVLPIAASCSPAAAGIDAKLVLRRNIAP